MGMKLVIVVLSAEICLTKPLTKTLIVNTHFHPITVCIFHCALRKK